MYTKLIIIIIFFFFHFASQFITIEAIIGGSSASNNKSYCPKEALIELEDKRNFNKNLALMPNTQHNSDDNTNANEDRMWCPCETKTCIPICCPHGQTITEEGCAPIDNYQIKNWRDTYFPQIHNSKNFKPHKRLHFNFNNLTTKPRHYHLFIHIFERDPCKGEPKNLQYFNEYSEDEFKLLRNGSIIQKKGNPFDLEDYCLSITGKHAYGIVTCLDVQKERINFHFFPSNYFEPSLNAGMFISLPFLLLTLIVYSIIPELKNIHGFTLRHYISFLLITYTLIAVVRTCVANNINFSDGFCTTIAFVVYFSIFSSFFWLNGMCFNIWRTFRGFHGLQRRARPSERKKYITYSIYAWGGALFFTAICLLMQFAPNIPFYIVRPQFGMESCGYIPHTAAVIYLYPAMVLISVCNIFFFVSTARKIIHHKKEMAHEFNGMDSCRHDDHEQRFNIYVKLFIVMGINWSIQMLSWIFQVEEYTIPEYIRFVSDFATTLQGVIIFITFVWEDRIKRLILKRLGINSPVKPQSAKPRDIAGYNCPSKISIPLHEHIPLNHISKLEPNHFATTITYHTDCV